MNVHELNEIIDIRKEDLKAKKYSYNFYMSVNNAWNKLISYISQNGKYYNEDIKASFLNTIKDTVSKKRFSYYTYAISIIDGLDNLNMKNRSCRIIRKDNNIVLSEYNKAIYDKYFRSREEYNSQRTLNDKKKIALEIIFYFENNNINFEQININDIEKIKKEILTNNIYSKKKRYLWVLRDILSYLYEEHYVNINYSYFVDKMKAPVKKIITTWTKDEVESIASSLSEDNDIEIRNKAMALLTIRLGIRFCDVKNLKFENIDWENNKLKFVQRKTNSYLELPLPEEIGNAIIKYIKNARPNTKEKYIFVSHDDRVCQLSDNFNIRKYLLKTYKNANVNYESKENKGIHTFRHALATNMLKSGTPLDIISSVLGHLNENSSKVYISVDNELLKSCCLELEDNNE